jgi:hypothetical protein
MKGNVKIINPIEYEGWDDLLLSSRGYSFFHCTAWAKVLKETYHYSPTYFSIIENRKLKALLPVMQVDSLLTGKRGVCLPFTDYCDPLLDGDVSFQDLIGHIIEYGRNRGWKYLELRGGRDQLPKASTSEYFLGHNLDMTRRENEILSGFRESTRRNIKKAKNKGVVVEICHGPEAVKEFFKLNCMTRRKHGLPSQPFRFFERIYDQIISRELGFVVLASYHGRKVAGAVFFQFGDRGIFKYGASDMNFQNLRPNNLVMWEAIRWFCNNGYKSLCLGRTALANKGLQQFKRGWGAKEHSIRYFKYSYRQEAFIAKNWKELTLYNRFFRNLPIPILNLLGSALYKHMG